MTITKLENRFLEPENWQKSDFLNPKTSHTIHFEYAPPPNGEKATIVALPGLSEFCEKYYETAQFFIEKGYGFIVLDWAYQGRSSRFKENPHKRHSDGYETDISDLKYLIDNYFNNNTPLFMLGHSMGGHIGLRFLIEYPKYFKASSFSAPMLGIRDLKHTGWLIEILKPLFNLFQTSYVPGGKDWHEDARESKGNDVFSSNPIRDSIHNAWCLHDPVLQVGNPTIKWVLESLSSCKFIKNNFKKIDIPILLAIAESEEIICNDQIELAAKKITSAKPLRLKKSKHEILMETDDIRDKFLNQTVELFKQSI